MSVSVGLSNVPQQLLENEGTSMTIRSRLVAGSLVALLAITRGTFPKNTLYGDRDSTKFSFAKSPSIFTNVE